MRAIRSRTTVPVISGVLVVAALLLTAGCNSAPREAAAIVPLPSGLPTEAPTVLPVAPSPEATATAPLLPAATPTQQPSATPPVRPKPSPAASTTAVPPPPAKGPWPGPGNTGVPAVLVLRPSGTITVTQPGTVIDGLDVSGCIIVRASNVTIKNTRVRGSSCDNGHNIDTGYGQYSGIVIQDVEIDGRNANAFGAGIGNSGFTCLRCNIHNVGQGANISDNVVIQDSWIHDVYYANGSHNEPVVSNGGSNLVIRHNTLSGNPTNGTSSALSLYGDFDQIRNVLVENNLFNGGSYCVYAGSVPGKPYPVAANTRFLNNTFGRMYYPSCGEYGPATAYASGNGNAWSGNVWADTGTPVTPD